DGITVVDVHAGKEACLIGHQMENPEAELGLCFNPEGSLLAVMDWQPESVRLIRLIEVPSGQERARFTVKGGLSGYFIGKGQYLVIKVPGDTFQELHFINPETGRELSSLRLPSTGGPVFSSDGQRMVTKDESMLRLLEVPTGEEVARWQENGIRSFFDYSGQWQVLVSDSRLIRLVDTTSGLEKSRAELDCNVDDSMMGSVMLRAEADLLVAACKDGEFRTLKASTGAETARFKVDGRVKFFSPDARFIVTQDEDG
ncbi:MAG: hypothetical protein LUQ69_10425, partial [Methanoregulaceae archaeon]|nr:hypothetical protein [Methanoregulaceae archaeon]